MASPPIQLGITSEKLNSNYLTFVFGTGVQRPTDEPVLKELDPREYVGPLLHPGDENPAAWRPGNELASEYIALNALWRNFLEYFERAKKESSGYSQKLLLKSAAVELRSLLDAAPRINGLIRQLPDGEGPPPRKHAGLFEAERSAYNIKYKAVNKEKSRVEKSLNQLRNNVGAHMSKPLLKGVQGTADAQPWEILQEHWNRLEPRYFFDLADALQRWLCTLRFLPVYEFYRFEAPDRIRCHVPCIVEQHGDEVHLPAISPLLAQQISAVAPDSVVAGKIVLKPEPLRLRVGWPESFLEQFPFMRDQHIEL